MISYQSTIIYDDKQIKTRIDTSNDSDIMNEMADMATAMLIKLDRENRKKNRIEGNHSEYRAICAHGGEGWLIENGVAFMSKDVAARHYDVIMACNNELWTPKPNSLVSAYAMGMPSGGLVVLRDSIKAREHDATAWGRLKLEFLDSDMRRDVPKQHPDGLHFVIGEERYSTINLGGCMDNASSHTWPDDLGLTFIRFYAFEDNSQPFIKNRS